MNFLPVVAQITLIDWVLQKPDGKENVPPLAATWIDGWSATAVVPKLIHMTVSLWFWKKKYLRDVFAADTS